mgnify:FL=1
MMFCLCLPIIGHSGISILSYINFAAFEFELFVQAVRNRYLTYNFQAAEFKKAECPDNGRRLIMGSLILIHLMAYWSLIKAIFLTHFSKSGDIKIYVVEISKAEAAVIAALAMLAVALVLIK